jgi:hypothetical protein
VRWSASTRTRPPSRRGCSSRRERVAGGIGSERSAPDAPNVVALRASLAPVRIDPSSELGGAMIFPLAVRGRLRGGLAALASRIAIARDDLLAQSLHTQTARLTAERDGLTERLVALERENALLSRLAGREASPSATSPFALE